MTAAEAYTHLARLKDEPEKQQAFSDSLPDSLREAARAYAYGLLRSNQEAVLEALRAKQKAIRLLLLPDGQQTDLLRELVEVDMQIARLRLTLDS